ncbi:DUF6461 domain-containing protein [Sphaerimonospora thailandensis]|nr:DUF6461 domain-containing protein [Sphaerimonospora thailandensis]
MNHAWSWHRICRGGVRGSRPSPGRAMNMNDWYDDEAVCVTYVRDLSPAEAFARMDVTIDPEAEPGCDPAIAVFRVEGGVILVEPNGFAGILDEVICRLSKGTVAASVFFNVNLDQNFVYAEDGVVTTQFEPDQPDARSGSDPDRLLEQMRTLDMETDSDLNKAAELAESVTGLTLPDDDAEPALIGTLPDYP